MTTKEGIIDFLKFCWRKFDILSFMWGWLFLATLVALARSCGGGTK